MGIKFKEFRKAMKKEQKVKVGQIWQDWDYRFRNDLFPRLIKIKDINIDKKYAFCESYRFGHSVISKTIIRIDRFKPTSTGYKLFKDVK